MKKSFIMLLCAFVLSLGMVACGGESPSPNKDAGTQKQDGDYNWDGEWKGETVTVTISNSDNNAFEVTAKESEINAKLMDQAINGNVLTGGYGYSYDTEKGSHSIQYEFTMTKNGATIEYHSACTKIIFDEAGHETKRNTSECSEVLTKIIKQ